MTVVIMSPDVPNKVLAQFEIDRKTIDLVLNSNSFDYDGRVFVNNCGYDFSFIPGSSVYPSVELVTLYMDEVVKEGVSNEQ